MQQKYGAIKLPENLLKEVDKIVGKHGFDSRADVVKDALRDFFNKYPETSVNGDALKKLQEAEQEV